VQDVSIVIKGAGEMASGIAHRLYTFGLTRICMIEIEHPLCVRRTVSFCEALFESRTEVEGVAGTLVSNLAELTQAWDRGEIGVIIDPMWKTISELRPDVVIDAILAKRNLGTFRNEAPLVIGVGPGFSAPDIVHVVIESNRSPNLGRPIYAGGGEPFTGIPAMRNGFIWERVLRAPHPGVIRLEKSIGDLVKAGCVVLNVDATPVRTPIDGVVRGLIREIEVEKNEKIGDIEPGNDPSCCWAISDKARAIGQGIVDAIQERRKGEY
jgi:xanthine dehydrogenase accessory factor